MYNTDQSNAYDSAILSRDSHMSKHNINTDEKTVSCGIKVCIEDNILSCDCHMIKNELHTGETKEQPRTICSALFTDRCDRQEHVTMENELVLKNETSYENYEFGMTYSTNPILRQHEKRTRTDANYIVMKTSEETKSSFTSEVGRSSRVTADTEKKLFACAMCDAVFSFKSSMLTHSSEKPYTCNICSIKFHRKDNAVRHRELHTVEQPYACDLCDAKFNRKELIEKHQMSHSYEQTDKSSPKEKYGCNMLKHAQRHTDEQRSHWCEQPLGCRNKIIICTKAGENPYTSLEVNEGKSEWLMTPRHTNVKKKYKCLFCGMEFARNANMTIHAKSHTGDKPFICVQCGKSFSIRIYLIKHKRTHFNEKSYTCEFCNAKFKQKISIDTHMRIHTGEKPYKCSYCYRGFTTRSSMKKHIIVHSGKKLHACEFCKSKFSTRFYLKLHKRKHHTGDVIYKCNECDAVFSRKKSITLHKKLHTGHIQYSCEFCCASFPGKGLLDVHERNHTGEKPYLCERGSPEKTTW